MSRIWWKPYLYISLTHSVAQNKKTSLPPAKASQELPPLHSSGQTGCSEATTCSCCPSQLFPPILPLKRLRTLRLCRPHHNSQHMCTPLYCCWTLHTNHFEAWAILSTQSTRVAQVWFYDTQTGGLVECSSFGNLKTQHMCLYLRTKLQRFLDFQMKIFIAFIHLLMVIFSNTRKYWYWIVYLWSVYIVNALSNMEYVKQFKLRISWLPSVQNIISIGLKKLFILLSF